jgi:hypothetical protein
MDAVVKFVRMLDTSAASNTAAQLLREVKNAPAVRLDSPLCSP